MAPVLKEGHALQAEKEKAMGQVSKINLEPLFI